MAGRTERGGCADDGGGCADDGGGCADDGGGSGELGGGAGGGEGGAIGGSSPGSTSTAPCIASRPTISATRASLRPESETRSLSVSGASMRERTNPSSAVSFKLRMSTLFGRTHFSKTWSRRLQWRVGWTEIARSIAW
jgi:hypothetical protein